MLFLVALNSGCQTFKPFSQTMRTRVAAARQWSGNGIAALRRGAAKEARDCFLKASSQMPHDHQIVANSARAHFQEGQIDKAIKEMQRAVDLRNDDGELLVELGEYYLASGQLEKANQQADKGLEKNHRMASAWLLKGKVRAANKDYQGALGDFQKSLGIDGSREDAQLQIVSTYQQLGDPLRALSAVEQLLQKYPTDRRPESAVLAKCSALVQLDQYSAAIEELERVSARAEISHEVFTHLAQAHLLAGEKSMAIQTLTRARKRFPENHELLSIMSGLAADSPTKVASRAFD